MSPVESVTWKVVAEPTTCAFVTMWPCSSSTMPEPRPSLVVICTTDGLVVCTTRSNAVCNSTADGRTPVAATVVASTAVAFVVGEDATAGLVFESLSPQPAITTAATRKAAASRT